MDYAIDHSIGTIINEYDNTMECLIYDDFAIEELENSHTMNLENIMEDIDDGINHIDM